jgi:hypothetical protein
MPTVRARRRSTLAVVIGGLALLGPLVGPTPAVTAAHTMGAALTRQVVASRMAVSFMANQGQSGPAVRYLGRGPGVTILFTDSAVLLDLSAQSVSRAITASSPRRADASIALRFLHANPHPLVSAMSPVAGTINEFIGDNPAGWRSGIAAFDEVVYHQLWPGIDATFSAKDGTLKYSFVVAAGADPAEIGLAYAGARQLTVEPSGILAITTATTALHDATPLSFQTIHGHRSGVATRYLLLGGTSFGFVVGPHAPGKPLTIDPGLQYSTYLGGAAGDSSFSVTADAAGDLYVFGESDSPNFPTTPGAYQRTLRGGANFFVAKFNPSGTSLIYSTFIGGTSSLGEGVAHGVVDASGDAYVTGESWSTDFPTTGGAYRRTAFLAQTQSVVFKLNPTGSQLVYSTYLAPDLISSGLGRQIGLGPDGSAIVIGNDSSDYAPTTPGAFQSVYPGGITAGYVARLDAAGAHLIFATYVGTPVTNQMTPGSGYPPACYLWGMAVDRQGATYVTGGECTSGFPTTPGAYQVTAPNGGGSLLVKLDPSGKRLDYATYYGDAVTPGGLYVRADAVAVDGQGDAYLTADAPAGAVPATPGAFASNCATGLLYCTAIAELNPSGTVLVYSTYFGAPDAVLQTGPDAIAVDSAGRAYVAGVTGSGLPTTPNAYSRVPGNYQVPFFVAAFGKGNLVYSTYFGGANSICFQGLGCFTAGSITIAPQVVAGAVYLGGTTSANIFPVTPGAYQQTYGGGFDDAWAAKLDVPS